MSFAGWRNSAARPRRRRFFIFRSRRSRSTSSSRGGTAASSFHPFQQRGCPHRRGERFFTARSADRESPHRRDGTVAGAGRTSRRAPSAWAASMTIASYYLPDILVGLKASVSLRDLRCRGRKHRARGRLCCLTSASNWGWWKVPAVGAKSRFAPSTKTKSSGLRAPSDPLAKIKNPSRRSCLSDRSFPGNPLPARAGSWKWLCGQQGIPSAAPPRGTGITQHGSDQAHGRCLRGHRLRLAPERGTGTGFPGS